ncbi:T-cell surface glycoprotein CD8 beta chain-like [Mixophyes fleayi]|uniref:T-cell surface glycoprotein CD8 beta chain-like n=1 Tax=Mixophyes fleayi TaxID=3061075 RepID=UPI003F4DD890
MHLAPKHPAKMKHPALSWLCLCCWFLLISFCVTEIPKFGTTLSQTPVSTIELVNNNIEISCTIKGESMDNLRLFWYRETNKKGDLEFIVSATTSMDRFSYGTNISESRFSIRRVKFQNYFTLKIMNLKFSDIGVYYCMAEMASKVSFGDGTRLSVVETLPTTIQPMTKKTLCKCTKAPSSKSKKSGCSEAIWAPLLACAVILLIGLYLLVSYTYRVYRRSHIYFRKHSPR